MFGFAVNETEQLMPYPIVLAHNLVRRQSFVRKNNILSFLRPNAIIETLQLRNPIYSQTASYGHFGRTDLDLPWERFIDLI